MSSTRQCQDLRMRKHSCEPDNHRRKDRWACFAKRQQRRLREAFHRFEIEGKLLRIIRLVEEGWRIVDVRLLRLRRHLSPHAGSERRLDELFRSARVVPDFIREEMLLEGTTRRRFSVSVFQRAD